MNAEQQAELERIANEAMNGDGPKEKKKKDSQATVLVGLGPATYGLVNA